MGRRKIEIKPIKDDRNRSVTFLKRKGGLFKKAFELGVLCQVDVAVIIFGSNKKLYEFSSGDINDTIGRFQYYAGAHEHKGPADYLGKGGGDDDDDEDNDMGSPPADDHTPPEVNPPSINLPVQQMRHVTPSASPPLPGGNAHRGSTPQPSRPSSRAAMPRPSSNLGVPAQYTPPQANMAQPPYGYAPSQQQHQQQQYYNVPQANMQRPSSGSYPPPPGHLQQQAYLHEQRRASMPVSFQPPPQRSPQPQQPQQHRTPDPNSRKPSPQADQGAFQSPPLPQPKPLSNRGKSHSIFTPIDDSRSLLAQHWGAPPEYMQSESRLEPPRSMSFDSRVNGSSPQPPQNGFENAAPPPAPMRADSESSNPNIAPVSRTNTGQSDAKRPRLKVQIPSENSDGGETSTDEQTASTTQAPPAKGVVLPPPSPSTNNPLMSAGASGPPNPFARPAPPSSQNLNRDQIETPLSALPSRVMDGNILPSPSDIWQTMFNRSGDNMMPSPLRFEPTPIQPTGPSFRDEPAGERKRSGDDLNGADSKRIKT
ncbi:hypothetical protein MBLNU457_7578t1 [Dothideomycetes sp. NU457]